MKNIIIIAILALSASLPSFSRCSDYTSDFEVRHAYCSGEYSLDGDNDGYACESTFNTYVGDCSTLRISTLVSHSGGLARDGCHYNRKTGVRHCH